MKAPPRARHTSVGIRRADSISFLNSLNLSCTLWPSHLCIFCQIKPLEVRNMSCSICLLYGSNGSSCAFFVQQKSKIVERTTKYAISQGSVRNAFIFDTTDFSTRVSLKNCFLNDKEDAAVPTPRHSAFVYRSREPIINRLPFMVQLVFS